MLAVSGKSKNTLALDTCVPALSQFGVRDDKCILQSLAIEGRIRSRTSAVVQVKLFNGRTPFCQGLQSCVADESAARNIQDLS